MNFWETLAVALISSSSAILASFLTNRSNESRLRLQSDLDSKKEFDKVRILKAEDIFKALGEYKSAIFKYHMDLVAYCKDEKTMTEALKFENDSPTFLVIIETGLAIYFPNLFSRFNKCREVLVPANSLYLKMLRNPRLSKDEKLSFVNTILDTGEKFDNEIDSICQEMISCIHKE